MKAIQLPQR